MFNKDQRSPTITDFGENSKNKTFIKSFKIDLRGIIGRLYQKCNTRSTKSQVAVMSSRYQLRSLLHSPHNYVHYIFSSPKSKSSEFILLNFLNDCISRDRIGFTAITTPKFQ